LKKTVLRQTAKRNRNKSETKSKGIAKKSQENKTGIAIKSQTGKMESQQSQNHA